MEDGRRLVVGLEACLRAVSTPFACALHWWSFSVRADASRAS
jgi:hypothetical protein